MQTRIGPALTWLSLVATIFAQGRPDFSGKWTETRAAAGQVAAVMTVSQDANAITVDTPSPRGNLRWIIKLDGSESKNATIQCNPPRQVEQVSTAAWEGNKLVISTSARSNAEGPYTLKQLWSLEGGTLTIATTQVSQTTGSTLRASKQTYSQQQAAVQGGHVEDIYIARSLRQSRGAPTAYCAEQRVGFGGSTFEDQYTFQSTTTRPSDGLLTNANVGTIGRLHACLGSTADPLTSNFYAEGVLGGASFTGSGECRAARQDYPEPGVTVYRCFLELRGLPSGYVGGQLTTNTVVSRQAIGEASDPPGYVQPSIATVRLWRRRS